ncbi:MAG: hypothetical protein K1X86_04955 [Ignavibacteria bacterium]|nr:hypothetical protein [Ignavibacteria bacterium]
MISKFLLKKLINQRIRDAESLIKKRCYYSSKYISGYAIELALKYKICKMYRFSKGFPETKEEFRKYFDNPNFSQKQNKELRIVISALKEIKTHDLSKLLYYSGEESRIKAACFDEWAIAFSWKPEMRYKLVPTKKHEAIVQ